MNVSKLFYKLTLIADIEIVVAFLPEMLSFPDQSPWYALLQRFQRVSKSALPRFAEQQMNVFGHNNVTVDAKLETASHTLQRGLECLFGNGFCK
jgi:hypothetical protein